MPRAPKKPIVERHSPRFEWPERHARLLGKIPDEVVAKKAGVSISTVYKERRRRGIEPFRPRRPSIEWTEEMIAVLGTDTDGNVAAMLGIPRGCVKRKRSILGIDPFVPPPHRANPGHQWTRREIALLGTRSDRKVAEALNLHVGTVIRKRHKLGIPPCHPPPPPIEWTEEMLDLLGKVSDAEVGQRYGISAGRVNTKRCALGIAAHIDKRAVVRKPDLIELLRLPSSVIRRRTGLKWSTIAELRQEYGIEASTAAEARWPPEVLARLGTVPDAEIAREVGLSADRVGAKRRSLGIPPPQRSWRRWTPDELALLETLAEETDEEIAARLGRTKGSIYGMRQQLAKRRRRGKPGEGDG